MAIFECVPNISEGRDAAIYSAVAEAGVVPGVTLLDVDPGSDTNRTVITLVGEGEALLEGVFRLVEAASKLIDMRTQTGAHPRMGAVDVVPFVPISGCTMDDCVKLAERLGARIGSELDLPVYLYGFAARLEARQNLGVSRAGEYEGLAEKIVDEAGKPDFGRATFKPEFGAVHVGARKLLLAYNVDLNATDKLSADRVAFDVREKGRTKIKKDGTKVQHPGTLKAARGIGWVIPQYGRAQVSLNLVDLDVTPLHKAFDACVDSATERGIRVTGSEVVGLLPLSSMLEAGTHYLEKQGRNPGVPESDLVHQAQLSLDLNDVSPFDPEERVIEYRLRRDRPLVSRSVADFVDETSRASPTPGGGSVAALAASLGAALASMVAALPYDRRKNKAKRPELATLTLRAQALKKLMVEAIDDDTWAFEALMEASRSGNEAAAREATLEAARVPLRVAEACPEIVELNTRAAKLGLVASLSDAAVGAIMARAAVVGAALNVRINLQDMSDDPEARVLLDRAEVAVRQTKDAADALVDSIWKQLD